VFAQPIQITGIEQQYRGIWHTKASSSNQGNTWVDRGNTVMCYVFSTKLITDGGENIDVEKVFSVDNEGIHMNIVMFKDQKYYWGISKKDGYIMVLGVRRDNNEEFVRFIVVLEE
jgi:hypothetical protein